MEFVRIRSVRNELALVQQSENPRPVWECLNVGLLKNQPLYARGSVGCHGELG